MLNVAVVGPGWWGRIIVGPLAADRKLVPLVGVDVAGSGRVFCREGVETRR